MNHNSNKIRFSSKKPKPTTKPNPINFQEPEDDKFHLLRQSHTNNYNFQSNDDLLIHQKQLEVDTNQNNDSMNSNSNIHDNDNIIEQNDDTHLKELIKKNNAENITFINTLLRLKKRVNSNDKTNNFNNYTNITNIPINNNGLFIKPDDDSKSYIKEFIDICESTVPKQEHIPSNENSFLLQTQNSICNNVNKNQVNPSIFTLTSNESTPKTAKQLSYIQNKTVSATTTANTGKTQNTQTPKNNKYIGLKTKDLIEITNRRKKMTETNVKNDLNIIKKEPEKIIQKDINNNIEIKSNDIQKISPQVKIISGQINHQVTNTNNHEIIAPNVIKKFPNELLKEENIHIQSSCSSFWGKRQPSNSNNKDDHINEFIKNSNATSHFNIKDNQFDIEINNNNNHNHHIPIEERLFYSTEDLEQEALILQQRQFQDNNQQHKPIKINLKAIKEEVKRKNASNISNTNQLEQQHSSNNISPTHDNVVRKSINNSFITDIVNYGNPTHTIKDNQNNNNCSIQHNTNEFTINMNSQINDNEHHNFNVNESSITNESNLKTIKSKLFDSIEGDSKVEEFDMYNSCKKQNESREIKLSQIKHQINNMNNANNNSIVTDNKIRTSINLSKLTNFVDVNSNSDANLSNYPSKKYFTPKTNYYGNLLGQSQTNSINSHGGTNSHIPIPLPHSNSKTNFKNSKISNNEEHITTTEQDNYDTNKVKLNIIDEEEMDLNNPIHIDTPTKEDHHNHNNINKDEENVVAEDMVVANIDLFDDNDEDEKEDLPENILPSKIPQNVVQAGYTTNNNNQQKIFNIDLDVDDAINPSYRFKKEQRNNVSKQPPGLSKKLSKSFCSSHPQSIMNCAQGGDYDNDISNQIPLPTDGNDKEINNINTSPRKQKHIKSNTNNFKTNNQNKRKYKFEPKRHNAKSSNTGRTFINNHNNIINTNHQNKITNINPSFDNYFKNLFMQEHQNKSYNVNNDVNHKISHVSYFPNLIKYNYSHNKQHINKQINLHSVNHDNELNSIINVNENLTEIINNALITKEQNKQIRNNSKNNKSLMYNNKNYGSSSYMVSTIVKEQLKNQFELQSKSRDKRKK